MGTLDFAVIGTNFISDWFAQAVSLTEGVHIRAVLSRKRETADAFADRHGIERRYTDLPALLADPDIDAVYIATPNMCHADMALAALSAGKHVLCEKPMALSQGDVTRMKDAARAAGKVLLEAMRPDFDPAYDALREALPRLGKIRRATMEYCQYSSRYDAFRQGVVMNAFDPGMKNAALADIGIYPLHMALSLFGMPADISSSHTFLSNGFEGGGHMTFTYPEMTADIVYSKICDSVNPSVIAGEDGSLSIDKLTTPHRIVLYPRGQKPEVIYDTAPKNNMVYEVRVFADMVEKKRDPASYLAVTEQTVAVYEKTVTEHHFFDGVRGI